MIDTKRAELAALQSAMDETWKKLGAMQQEEYRLKSEIKAEPKPVSEFQRRESDK